jgi:hypothetical protein
MTLTLNLCHNLGPTLGLERDSYPHRVLHLLDSMAVQFRTLDVLPPGRVTLMRQGGSHSMTCTLGLAPGHPK